jgi:two-component system, OmpR family, sensor histidine kinase TctE
VLTKISGDKAILEIEDNGPGIAPEDRERVLQRFQRGAHNPGQGSGLGLAIVSDIVKAHDAQLQLNDGSHGKGLCVQVAFPNAALLQVEA